MNHSTNANPHPINSNCAQINKLISTADKDNDDNDKIVEHSNCTTDVCKRVLYREIQTSTNHGIFDSGMTGHFLLSNAPMIYKQVTTNPLHITLPDGFTTSSTHTFLLDVPHLAVIAQISQVEPDLAHSSIISIKQFCDAGCRGEYEAKNCHVYFNKKS